MDTGKKTIITICTIWATAMLTVLAIQVLAISPVQKSAGQMHSDLLEETYKLNRAAKLLNEGSLQASAEQLWGTTRIFKKYVTHSESAYNFALEVSQIAKRVGIIDMETQGSDSEMFRPVVNCPNIRMSKITIACTGSYRQMVNLINTLESHQPLILIHSFDISTNKKSSVLMDMKMELRMIVEGEDIYKNRKKLELILLDQNQTGGEI
jgi:hypothetical protein